MEFRFLAFFFFVLVFIITSFSSNPQKEDIYQIFSSGVPGKFLGFFEELWLDTLNLLNKRLMRFLNSKINFDFDEYMKRVLGAKRFDNNKVA